jgi:CO dehydrogenase/acetyl-CoA synthase alpha subunit
MEVERQIANAPKTTAVGNSVSALEGKCVGCTNCRGLCQALIEVMTFPEVVLNRS